LVPLEDALQSVVHNAPYLSPDPDDAETYVDGFGHLK